MSNFPGKIVEFFPVTLFFLGKNFFFEFSEKISKFFFNEIDCEKCSKLFSMKLTVKNFRKFLTVNFIEKNFENFVQSILLKKNFETFLENSKKNILPKKKTKGVTGLGEAKTQQCF